MATLSSPGIGSGLDIKSIVAQMVALEKRPLAQLQSVAASSKAKFSAFGQLKAQLANLQDQAAKLSARSTWTGLNLTSSNSGAVNGTVDPTGIAGKFSVTVERLAQAQSTVSAAVSAQANLAGSLSISIGAWADLNTDPLAPGSPTFPTTTSITVEIDPGDSLKNVAEKINASGAGITATVLRDSSGERLLVRSAETGAANGFRIVASNAPLGSELSKLGFDPETTATGMVLTQSAVDTVARINGVEVRSADNEFKNVLTGVTLNVKQTTPEGMPIEITVGRDTTNMRAAINSFIESYNAISNALTEMTKYNQGDKSAGTLQGDATAVGLQNSLRRLVTNLGGSVSDSFNSLSAIGIQFQEDGTLKLKEETFSKSLEEPDRLQRYFAGTTNQIGFGEQVQNLSKNLLGIGGTLTNRSNALQSSIDRNKQEQERIMNRIGMVEERLYSQYSKLDANLASLTALSNYVSQQVTAWNNQKS